MTTISYSTADLLPFNRHDVTPSRATRKVIFSLRLWKPTLQRKHSRRCGYTVVSRSRSPFVRYGCINIRSVNNKFDDVMQIFRDYQLSVLGLTETWHDTDSPVFDRCRMAGFSVVDRPRARVRDDLSVNHGGVAIVAAPGM